MHYHLLSTYYVQIQGHKHFSCCLILHSQQPDYHFPSYRPEAETQSLITYSIE